jgi:hypothetical protein
MTFNGSPTHHETEGEKIQTWLSLEGGKEGMQKAVPVSEAWDIVCRPLEFGGLGISTLNI